jgi:hypothetical protein
MKVWACEVLRVIWLGMKGLNSKMKLNNADVVNPDMYRDRFFNVPLTKNPRNIFTSSAIIIQINSSSKKRNFPTMSALFK